MFRQILHTRFHHYQSHSTTFRLSDVWCLMFAYKGWRNSVHFLQAKRAEMPKRANFDPDHITQATNWKQRDIKPRTKKIDDKNKR